MGTRHEEAVVPLVLSVGSFYSPLFLLSVGPIWPIWWKLLQEFFFFWLQGRVLAWVHMYIELVVLDMGIAWPCTLGPWAKEGQWACPLHSNEFTIQYSTNCIHLPVYLTFCRVFELPSAFGNHQLIAIQYRQRHCHWQSERYTCQH